MALGEAAGKGEGEGEGLGEPVALGVGLGVGVGVAAREGVPEGVEMGGEAPEQPLIITTAWESVTNTRPVLSTATWPRAWKDEVAPDE